MHEKLQTVEERVLLRRVAIITEAVWYMFNKRKIVSLLNHLTDDIRVRVSPHSSCCIQHMFQEIEHAS